MTLHDVTLDDKFDLGQGAGYSSRGAQAIVRMLMMQQERDRLAGLDTAGFVSGYRGSPLGGLDQQFWRAGKHLGEHRITFQPGLNEELAATACWGTQQAELDGHGRYDGVFALWYGKGPGVDRSGDVFRHANLAGSSKHGGVLALMGDDHTAESSTNAHADGIQFRRLDGADPQSGRRPGTDRLWALRLRAVALRGHLGGAEMRQGQHRVDGLGRCRRSSG